MTEIPYVYMFSESVSQQRMAPWRGSPALLNTVYTKKNDSPFPFLYSVNMSLSQVLECQK